MTEQDFTAELRKLNFGTELVNELISTFYKLQEYSPGITLEEWINHIIETERNIPDTPDGFVSLEGCPEKTKVIIG